MMNKMFVLFFSMITLLGCAQKTVVLDVKTELTEKVETKGKSITDSDSLIKIVVAFNKGVSAQQADALFKSYNLGFERTKNVNKGRNHFYDSGENFIVDINSDNLQYWIDVFSDLDIVYDVSEYIDPAIVRID